MHKLLLVFTLVAVSPLFMYMSCKDSTVKAPGPCTEPVMCTQMFAMVTAQVVDAVGNPVKLDEAYTVRAGTSDKITSSQEPGMNNAYVVLDDSYQKKLAQTTAAFRFVGMKDGKKVVDEPYTISADCCHIKKESGPTTITIQ